MLKIHDTECLNILSIGWKAIVAINFRILKAETLSVEFLYQFEQYFTTFMIVCNASSHSTFVSSFIELFNA